MSKQAEEILNRFIDKEDLKGIYNTVLNVMEVYADQEKKAYRQEQLKKIMPSDEEIDTFVDDESFVVPYDGSNNFYNEDKLKGLQKGIEWLKQKILKTIEK